MRKAAEFLTHPMFSPAFRRFGRYDTIDWFRLYSHYCCILDIIAVQLRSVTEIASKSSFLCLNGSPVHYGVRVSAKAIRYSENIALHFLLRHKLFDFERWHWSCHVRQTLPWSGVVGIRYFWHFFLPCFCHNFGCKVFFASHESRREKSDLRVLTSDAGH